MADDDTSGADSPDSGELVVGHSNGGEGAHIVGNWFEERPWQRARGAALASVWLDAFVRRFIFADLGIEPVLYGRITAEVLENPAWWDYHPAYA